MGSSSGTFVNRVRLSPTNETSIPLELKDGDAIQLGVDYQGKDEKEQEEIGHDLIAFLIMWT